nr:MAG TPA: hypothetical protein [Caudoviricetes sp.]
MLQIKPRKPTPTDEPATKPIDLDRDAHRQVV